MIKLHKGQSQTYELYAKDSNHVGQYLFLLQKETLYWVLWKNKGGTKYVVVSKLFLVLCHHWFYFKSHEFAKKVFNKSFTSSRAEVVCFHNYFPFMMLIVRMFPFLSFLDNRHDVRFAQFNYSFTERKSFVRDVCEMFGIEKHDEGLQFKTDDRW